MLENLNLFFTDFAIDVTIDDQSYRGIFEEFDDDLSVNASGRAIILTMKTSDTANIDRSSSVSVKGSDYEIVNIRPIDDGQITEIDLKEL